MGEVIAVLSGKGGTGKTSICAGLASALAMAGQRVLCIDCDIGLRNLDLALGLGELNALAFTEVCSGHYALSQALRHPMFENLSFLTAPVNCRADQISAQAFSELLAQARREYRYIFLDAPAGIELGFQLCACQADRVILVTCSEPAAVRDAARASALLEQMGKSEVRLVVNRINKKMFKDMKVTVDDVMDQAGLPLLGIVPEDRNVTLAVAFERPLLYYTTTGAAAACKRIAKRIQGLPVSVALHGK